MFSFLTGVPFTGLNLSELAPSSSSVTSVLTFHEGDSLALSAGTWMGGRDTWTYLQSSGIGNLMNTLQSLVIPGGIPLCLFVSERGGAADAEQHQLDPWLLEKMFELPAVTKIENKSYSLAEQFSIFRQLIQSDKQVVVFGDTLQSSTLRHLDEHSESKDPEPSVKLQNTESPFVASAHPRFSRIQVIEQILSRISPQDIKVATTGNTCRELFHLNDQASNFYNVGAMGATSLVGLGISLATQKRVIILDGDGALLMRLGALASLGRCPSIDCWHFILDNGTYESTGGQPSSSATFDLVKIARGFGYTFAVEVNEYSESLHQILCQTSGPKLVRIKLVNPTRTHFSRPAITLRENAHRLRTFLKGHL